MEDHQTIYKKPSPKERIFGEGFHIMTYLFLALELYKAYQNEKKKSILFFRFSRQ